jgi:hypothetical protein
MFGSALQYLKQVDCSEEHACDDYGVRSFPTWSFKDGSRLRGVQSPTELASKTRCTLGGEQAPPTGAGADLRRDDDGGVTRSLQGGVTIRERKAGGAQIIEIPGR